MDDDRPFHNLYSHGFVRLAVARPLHRIADPHYNADQTAAAWQDADTAGAALVLFPELGLSSYTCDDLFHQAALLDGCEQALSRLVHASKRCAAAAVVGLPLRVGSSLFNCAAVLHAGRILGFVPKSYLPNYAEFYEARQFSAAPAGLAQDVVVDGQSVPFGARLLFRVSNLTGFTFHVEICEDLWVPVPPSSHAALAGASVLLNLSASNVTVSKADYRRALVSMQSARCIAAYAYASAGFGESTTDMAWDGQSLICENGEVLAESTRFAMQAQTITADIDLERLLHDRMRQGSFGDSVARHREELACWRTVAFALQTPALAVLPLQREIPRFPYVPARADQRDARCAEVYQIQVQGLVQRMASAGVSRLVIGVSGGLDSTHALLVCARAMDLLGLPRDHILGFTMPGFATSARTLDQAQRLMTVLGCSARTLDIRPSCEQMLKDIGHPFAQGEPQHDVTFENVQAGERTSHLFRLANLHQAIVVGTGDLSELALGWCTYGVGDHMSHYSVNASVPKTLIKHLVRWVAQTQQVGEAGGAVLRDVLDTEVSPELVPGAADAAAPHQSTESVVGPYELQDFHLYHLLRHGYRPSKVAFLAIAAWRDRRLGTWPDGPDVTRNEYALADIKRHLRVLVMRFFQGSQFKRSCVPNAPKVGSGGSLSPRGDWRAPSDAAATVWLQEMEHIPD